MEGARTVMGRDITTVAVAATDMLIYRLATCPWVDMGTSISLDMVMGFIAMDLVR